MNAHPFSQHWPLLLLSTALIASLALAGLLRTSAAGDTPGKQETPPQPPAGPAVVSTDSILHNSPEEDDYLEEIQGAILAANYAEARRACDSMLLEFQEKYGKESIPAAKVWHLLGVIKSGESQLDSSLVFYQRALRIREKAYLGNPHPDLGMTYNNIGILRTQCRRRPRRTRPVRASHPPLRAGATDQGAPPRGFSPRPGPQPHHVGDYRRRKEGI